MSHHRVSDLLADHKTHPSRGLVAAGGKVNNQGRSAGPTSPTDRLAELATTPHSVSGRKHDCAQADSRARPLRRRDDMIDRPARVRMRNRNP